MTVLYPTVYFWDHPSISELHWYLFLFWYAMPRGWM